MIAIDTNILVYAHREDSTWHAVADRCVGRAAESGRRGRFPGHDARVAALCRQHGVSELWTADRDFGRFAGLRWKNPLLSAG